MNDVNIDFGSPCGLGLDVKHPRFLAFRIRCTPNLSVKNLVKKCILYMRNYGSCFFKKPLSPCALDKSHLGRFKTVILRKPHSKRKPGPASLAYLSAFEPVLQFSL